ncbi:hypothetical protein VCV18_012222 [Metarhizium anisopliae]
MEVGKILKLLFWGFALVHLVGSVWICITASHLNTKENKERGIFVYKITPQLNQSISSTLYTNAETSRIPLAALEME